VYYRAVIFTSDVALICGISDRAARRKLRKIRQKLSKEPDHYVTVEEFCFSTGIPESLVYQHFDAIGENQNRKQK